MENATPANHGHRPKEGAKTVPPRPSSSKKGYLAKTRYPFGAMVPIADKGISPSPSPLLRRSRPPLAPGQHPNIPANGLSQSGKPLYGTIAPIPPIGPNEAASFKESSPTVSPYFVVHDEKPLQPMHATDTVDQDIPMLEANIFTIKSMASEASDERILLSRSRKISTMSGRQIKRRAKYSDLTKTKAQRRDSLDGLSAPATPTPMPRPTRPTQNSKPKASKLPAIPRKTQILVTPRVYNPAPSSRRLPSEEPSPPSTLLIGTPMKDPEEPCTPPPDLNQDYKYFLPDILKPTLRAIGEHYFWEYVGLVEELLDGKIDEQELDKKGSKLFQVFEGMPSVAKTVKARVKKMIMEHRSEEDL